MTNFATAMGLVGLLAFCACSESADLDEGNAPTGDASASSKGAMSPANTAKMKRPASKTLMLPTTMEYPAEEPWFNVYRPENLDATGEPLPVIAWANGGCYRSDFTWEPLFKRWAAGGFVVLALTMHPERGAMVQTSIAEQGGLVDWALKQAMAKDGAYAGKLDPEQIVAAGNSCGGVTALGLAAQDPRIAAVFVLSGSSGFGAANRAVIDKISVPVGYIVGGPQDIAGGNATSDYDALPDGVPAMIVSRFEGDHRTVSTDPAILAHEAEIALNWMDLALYGTEEAHEELTSATVCADCESGHFALKSKHLEKLLD
jgi:predicted dienelactone hydrolase